MPDTAFFVYITIAIIAFGSQGPLVVSIARERDGLIAAAYRGGFLALTLLPLLFFTSLSEIFKILGHLPSLSVAAVSGALSYYFGLSAVRLLPVGVHGAIRQSAMSTGAIALGVFLLSEYLTLPQVMSLSVVIFSSVALALTQKGSTLIRPTLVGKGLRMSAMSGFFGALSFYFFSIISREMHPFVATFFWESSIAACTVLALISMRATGNYKKSMRLSGKDLLHIAGAGLLAMCASVSYSFAVNHGPFALASGLFASTVLIGIVAGRIVFKEKLSYVQMFFITLAAFGMFLVKVAS